MREQVRVQEVSESIVETIYPAAAHDKEYEIGTLVCDIRDYDENREAAIIRSSSGKLPSSLLLLLSAALKCLTSLAIRHATS